MGIDEQVVLEAMDRIGGHHGVNGFGRGRVRQGNISVAERADERTPVTDEERADIQQFHQPYRFRDLGQGGDDRHGTAHGVFDTGALVGKDSQLFGFGGFEIETRPLPPRGSHGRAIGVGRF
jgi:hypothetical protein